MGVGGILGYIIVRFEPLASVGAVSNYQLQINSAKKVRWYNQIVSGSILKESCVVVVLVGSPILVSMS